MIGPVFMQFAEDRTFRFSVGTAVFWRNRRSRGNPWGAEGYEEIGDIGPDIEVRGLGNHLLE